MSLESVKYINFLIGWAVAGTLGLIGKIIYQFAGLDQAAYAVSTVLKDVWLFSLSVGTLLFIALALSQLIDPLIDGIWPNKSKSTAPEDARSAVLTT